MTATGVKRVEDIIGWSQGIRVEGSPDCGGANEREVVEEQTRL